MGAWVAGGGPGGCGGVGQARTAVLLPIWGGLPNRAVELPISPALESFNSGTDHM